VHLADDGGMPLAQGVCRAAKNFILGAFDVALDEIGRRVGAAIVVERNGFDANDIRGFIVIPGDVAEATIGGPGDVGAGERDSGGLE
jgi:hypothetical protein